LEVFIRLLLKILRKKIFKALPLDQVNNQIIKLVKSKIKKKAF